MWIGNLADDEALRVLGDQWREIRRMTLEVADGMRPNRPNTMTPDDFEGALFLYGVNGPSVYLFLQSWQTIYRGGLIAIDAASEKDVIKVTDASTLKDPTESRRWRTALMAAGYQQRGTALANVWQAGMKVGRELGTHTFKFLAAAAAGELAQAAQRDLHFFLAMMPWVRAGQLPCNWDDTANRLVVEWLDVDHVRAFAEAQAAQELRELVWPTAAVGMRVRDEEALIRTAKHRNIIIIVRDGCPGSLRFIGIPGYLPRPAQMVGFTRREPPHVGLLAAADDKAVSGYSVSAPEDGRIIRDGAGNAFYPGVELVGVYRFATGTADYSESLRRELNRRFGEDLLQEGPSDDAEHVHDIRARGAPVTAFMPDRAPIRLATTDDMREFYTAFDIDWDEAYASMPRGLVP